ncbi:phage shock protein C (PspC) family protein [Dyadobacter koreensis]|uniref:Phage shock protein C (PspC) family protein n=1 Tax=Dyadobacter koreensis TaxID=408657 RepID=A0A1H7A1H9_9BACT|nr:MULTISPECIES: PspC domain-containing protein [Dyadobacter]MCF2445227.1 PspC domain-containing protein [Dyadobacter sp. CY345]SEJ55700.1 phage shock protein C (PspC) family protein [Dyadobacter koreensis]
MNNNRLFRDVNNKVIGGVAAGIANYLQIDVVIIRVLLVMGFFIPVHFPVFIFYIVMWIAMPKGVKTTNHIESSAMH